MCDVIRAEDFAVNNWRSRVEENQFERWSKSETRESGRVLQQLDAISRFSKALVRTSRIHARISTLVSNPPFRLSYALLRSAIVSDANSRDELSCLPNEYHFLGRGTFQKIWIISATRIILVWRVSIFSQKLLPLQVWLTQSCRLVHSQWQNFF